MISRILFTLGFWLIIDLYFFQAWKVAMSGFPLNTRKYLAIAYWAFDLILMSVFIYFTWVGKLRPGGSTGISFYIGLMFLSLLPKLTTLPILLIEDSWRFVESGTSWVKSMFSETSTAYYPSRRKFMGQMAVGLAALQFSGILYGITKGKYNYRVVRKDVWFPDLPEAFDHFTITQLSDIHSGSFDDANAVAEGVRLANAQKSDLLVFTGDLVNSRASEMLPYKAMFGSLDAAFGKFSILGNHDYGDYASWPTDEEKKENFNQLCATHQEMGFNLLRNQALTLEKDGQRLDLVGVENWGRGGFHKYGDLNKALVDTTSGSFKILLSHDPSHWEAEAVPHQEKIHLTLSGHTHGMQFGVEVPGFKWSPVQYVYKQWSGLYSKAEQQLYVNRGFGFVGFPGRVCMWPEISVLMLRVGVDS
jgi:predicted MPP superfamily phosphohydrolase